MKEQKDWDKTFASHIFDTKKNVYPEYVKNFQNSIVRKQLDKNFIRCG